MPGDQRHRRILDHPRGCDGSLAMKIVCHVSTPHKGDALSLPHKLGPNLEISGDPWGMRRLITHAVRHGEDREGPSGL